MKTGEVCAEILHLLSFAGDTSPVKLWASIFLLFLLIVSIPDGLFLLVFSHPMSI